MKLLKLSIAALILIFTFENITNAAIINLDARKNIESNPITLQLPEGRYRVIPAGVKDGGLYDAWNAWSDNNCRTRSGCSMSARGKQMGWVNVYAVKAPNISAVWVNDIEIKPIRKRSKKISQSYFTIGSNSSYYKVTDNKVYPDQKTALSYALSSSFSLSGASSVSFFIPDRQPADNLGGMFLIVESVLPQTIMSPVKGSIGIVHSLEDCHPLNITDKWCFNQHKAGFHTKSGGIGGSNDIYAWDLNLNSPLWDSDKDKQVFAVSDSVVEDSYAGSKNAGGNAGQILIRHNSKGKIWWSGYLHLKDIKVSKGQRVSNKSLLGYISNIGTHNNHLHFVVYTGENKPNKLSSFNTQFIER